MSYEIFNEIDNDEYRIILEEINSVNDLNICVLIFKESNNSEYELCRRAAVCAMRIFANRLDEYYFNELKISAGERNKYYRIGISKEDFEGTKITLSEFIGPGYDYKNRITYRVKKQNQSYRLFNDCMDKDFQKEIPANLENLYPYSTKGFAQCFLQPPYENPRGYADELLIKFMDGYIFNISEPVIYLWNSDWSNHFESGKEWWGSYFWTVLDKSMRRIIVICASTTD